MVSFKTIYYLLKACVIGINKEDNETIASIFYEIANQFKLEQKKSLEKQFKNCIYRIHERLQKGISYRNISKLTPITLFMFLKVKNVSFQKRKFLDTLNLKEEDFNRGLKRIVPVYPEYQQRDRINIIGSKLKDVLIKFKLSDSFLNRCESIFKDIYPRIAHSTDGTITGILSILSLITLDMEGASLSDICKYSGTTLGSVHNATKRILFNKEERSRFQGLIKSKDLVKAKLTEKTGFNVINGIQKSEMSAKVRRTSTSQVTEDKRKISKKRMYSLSNKQIQEIIRLHFYELPPEKISDQVKIKIDIIKTILSDFSDGNISFESRKAPAAKPTERIDINLYNLKENPFPQNGPILKIEKLPVICEKCGNPLLKLVYENEKTIFFCKYCYK